MLQSSAHGNLGTSESAQSQMRFVRQPFCSTGHTQEAYRRWMPEAIRCLVHHSWAVAILELPRTQSIVQLGNAAAVGNGPSAYHWTEWDVSLQPSRSCRRIALRGGHYCESTQFSRRRNDGVIRHQRHWTGWTSACTENGWDGMGWDWIGWVARNGASVKLWTDAEKASRSGLFGRLCCVSCSWWTSLRRWGWKLRRSIVLMSSAKYQSHVYNSTIFLVDLSFRLVIIEYQVEKNPLVMRNNCFLPCSHPGVLDQPWKMNWISTCESSVK